VKQKRPFVCEPGASRDVRPGITRDRAEAEGGVLMMKELSDLPAGVVGFEVAGELKAEDYRDVVLPALERAAASGEVRFVVVIPEFHGMSGGAVWQDLKVGIEHWRAWKRIALVTDIGWMEHMTSLFGWMTPGEVRHFPLAQRDDAIAWAAA
jgi:hypothetical protein